MAAYYPFVSDGPQVDDENHVFWSFQNESHCSFVGFFQHVHVSNRIKSVYVTRIAMAYCSYVSVALYLRQQAPTR